MISNGNVPWLTGHGLRFKTKADKRKAEEEEKRKEEERKENEKLDHCPPELKKSGDCSSPQPLADPYADQAQLPV